MTDLEDGRAYGEMSSSSTSTSLWLATFVWNVVCLVVSLAGIVSTVYLVVQALVMLFFVVGFINYSTPNFEWEKVANVALSAVPLFCFGAIGVVGLKFSLHRRFRLWGLSASVLQTAAAIFLYASSEGFLIFMELISRIESRF